MFPHSYCGEITPLGETSEHPHYLSPYDFWLEHNEGKLQTLMKSPMKRKHAVFFLQEVMFSSGCTGPMNC